MLSGIPTSFGCHETLPSLRSPRDCRNQHSATGEKRRDLTEVWRDGGSRYKHSVVPMPKREASAIVELPPCLQQYLWKPAESQLPSQSHQFVLYIGSCTGTKRRASKGI